MKLSILSLSLLAASGVFAAGAHAAQPAKAQTETLWAVQQGHGASAKGVSPLAIGTQAKAEGNSVAALGSRAYVKGNGSTALGMDAQVKGNLSVAAGAHAKALHNATSAYGSNATAGAYSSTAIGKGTLASGIATFAGGNHATASGGADVAVGSHANASGGYGVALGANSKTTGNAAVAVGGSASASKRFSAVFGYKAQADHADSVALGANSKTSQAVRTTEATVNGIKYGGFAGGNPTGNVSIGNDKAARTLTNVAAGRINKTSTDAINGSQLYLVAHQVGDNKGRLDKHERDINRIDLNLSRLQQSNTYLNNRIDGVERESRAGVAGALATANIPQAHKEGQFAVGAGVGHFRGQNAAAVGASYITSGGRLVLKGSGFANTGRHGKYGVGAGVAYTFGGRDTVRPVVQPVVVERVVQEVIVREVQPATGKRVRQ